MRGALIAGVMTVGVLTSVPAWAVDSLPTTEPDIAKRLATFDPRAVAAAQHYYETPSIKTGLLAMVDNMNKGMIGLVTRNNPNLTPEQTAKVEVAVSDALKVRLDLLLRMNMVAALDTFSTDELIAMDTFYSSPVGASILQKMPKLSAKLPAMMRAFVPDYMNDVKARLKTSSPELKL